MLDIDPATAPDRARANLLSPVLALAAAGIAIILISGSLGAATSGRGILSHWFDPPRAEQRSLLGQAPDGLARTSDLPEVVIGSGA